MKYYKILNEDECHNGLQYKTGLNVDILPFYPHGDCEPGGIYFAREDILNFLSYGPWIREVTIPPRVRVYKNPGYPVKWKAKRVILGRRRRITDRLVLGLIKEGAHINSDVLDSIAELGFIKSMKFMLDAGWRSHFALPSAARKGQVEIVKLLLEEYGESNKCYALQMATQCGHVECVKLLLTGTDCDGVALFDAASLGKTECLKVLLDAGVRDISGKALDASMVYGYSECTELLLKYKVN
jgi:hypothetical protein